MNEKKLQSTKVQSKESERFSFVADDSPMEITRALTTKSTPSQMDLRSLRDILNELSGLINDFLGNENSTFKADLDDYLKKFERNYKAIEVMQSKPTAASTISQLVHIGLKLNAELMLKCQMQGSQLDESIAILMDDAIHRLDTAYKNLAMSVSYSASQPSSSLVTPYTVQEPDDREYMESEATYTYSDKTTQKGTQQIKGIFAKKIKATQQGGKGTQQQTMHTFEAQAIMASQRSNDSTQQSMEELVATEEDAVIEQIQETHQGFMQGQKK